MTCPHVVHEREHVSIVFAASPYPRSKRRLAPVATRAKRIFFCRTRFEIVFYDPIEEQRRRDIHVDMVRISILRPELASKHRREFGVSIIENIFSSFPGAKVETPAMQPRSYAKIGKHGTVATIRREGCRERIFDPAPYQDNLIALLPCVDRVVHITRLSLEPLDLLGRAEARDNAKSSWNFS